MDNIPFFRKNIAIDVDFVRWTWKDAIWRFKKIITLSVLGSYGRLLAQLGALSIIYRYVRALESNKTIDYFGYTIQPRASVELLFAISIVVFCMFSVSAFSEYTSRSYLIKLRRLYEEFCLRRLLVLSSRLPHPSTLIANRMLSEEEMSRNGRSESQTCARFLSEIVSLISPLATFLFAAMVLFYISWVFSLIILLLSFISLIFLVKINFASAETSRLTERYTQTSSQERLRLSRRIEQSAVPIDNTDKFLNGVFSIGELGKYQDVIFNRFILKEKTRLVINILTAVSILTILLVTGMGIIYARINWSIFFAYLVSLQYFLNNMMKVGNIFTDVSRLYPQVNRYYKFVNDAEKATDSESDKPEVSKITLAVPSLESDQQTIDLEPGMLAFLYHPGPVNRDLAIMLHNHTYMNSEKLAPIYWYMQHSDFVGSTLRQVHGFPEALNDDIVEQELRAHLPGISGNGLMKIGLDEIITEEHLSALNQDIISGLKLISAIHSKHLVALINEKEFNALSDITQGSIRTVLSESVLIVVSNGDKLPKNSDGSSIFLASNGKELIGWSSVRWLIDNPDILNEIPTTILQNREAYLKISQDVEEDENY